MDADLTPSPAKGQIKSKERVSKHGEVFTAEREVNAMLDLVKQECEERAKKKQYTQLQYEKNAVWAVSSIYGIELLPDNAEACRQRLYKEFCLQYERLYGQQCKPECCEAVAYLLERNIIMGDALTYRRVDNPEEWIVVSEWSFIGDGKTGQGGDLFSDLPCATFPPVYFLNLNHHAYEK